MANDNRSTRVITTILGRVARFILVATAAAFGAGCGGGGGGGATSNPPPAPVPAGKNPGTVIVTITDESRVPAAGITVYLGAARGWSADAVADASGQVTFHGVPAGTIAVNAGINDDLGDHEGGALATLAENGTLELDVSLQPKGWGFGLANATVNAPGTNGRSVEFALRVIYQTAYQPLSYDTPPFHMTIDNCTPNDSNDASVPDCVRGPSGFDAPYNVVGDLDPPVANEPGGSPTPFSAALLIDQSSNAIAQDPPSFRLFSAKYFVTNKGANNRVAVAAFANDSASGALSLLPSAPVTIYPVGNPAFAASGNDLYTTIDSLSTLSGGSAPLYAALDELLDFTASSSTAMGDRAIVALSAGSDDTCGSPRQCDDAQQALIEKSRAAGIKIITVGVASAVAQTNSRALTELASATGGASLWIDNTTVPGRLAFVVGNVARVLDGSQTMLTAHFRIESSTDGAFQSGRTVFGTLRFCVSAGGCYDYPMPFAVPIP